MSTIFGKIIRREIPADIVYETDEILAFKDINPVAPTHVLVIPKREIPRLSDVGPDDAALMGSWLVGVAETARQLGLEDYRMVVNCGAGACQSVFHLHAHIIAGRTLTWPPG